MFSRSILSSAHHEQPQVPSLLPKKLKKPSCVDRKLTDSTLCDSSNDQPDRTPTRRCRVGSCWTGSRFIKSWRLIASLGSKYSSSRYACCQSSSFSPPSCAINTCSRSSLRVSGLSLPRRSFVVAAGCFDIASIARVESGSSLSSSSQRLCSSRSFNMVTPGA